MGAKDPYVGHVLGDRYLVKSQIGSGGMATVYLAQHTLIGRNVAVKVLHTQFARDPGCVKRFMNEGRAAGTLGHPNIVESTDMGFAPDGAPFLVLELLRGKTLSAEVHQVGAFPVKRAARIAVQIASALTTAHAHHIIHRDLKPENVFLLPDDETDDHVKILDFGIARFMRSGTSQATQQGALLGTPDFMAPEQITTPDKVDIRIDVYALGAILYKMLTGRAPFHNTPFPLILNSIQNDTPEPISNLRPSLPIELVEIIDRAMAKDPTARYQTIDELLTALLPFAGLSLSQVVVRKRAVTPMPGIPSGQTQPGGAYTPHDTGARARAGSAERSESALRASMGSQPALHPSQQYLAGTPGPGTGTPVIVQHHKSRWTAVAAVAALLAAGGAVAAVLMMRDAQPRGTHAAALPPSEAAAKPQRSADDELALYLDEVGRLVEVGRFDRAQELLQKARAIEGASAQLEVQLSQVTDEVEHGAALAKAERALSDGDRASAVDAAKLLLDRNSADEAALSILQRARAAAEAEAPTPTAPPGKLYVRSATRATVYLDDIVIGRTPIKGFEVPAGAHVVELRRSGYAPRTKQVTINARKSTRVKMDLEEIEPKAEPKPEVASIQPRVGDPALTRPDPEPKPEPKPEPEPEPKVVPKVVPEPEPEPEPEPKIEPKPRAADAIAAPRLPKTHKVDKVKELSRALQIIEREAIDRGGVDVAVAKGVTAKLARAAYDSYAPGKTIAIQPRAIYYTIVKRARAGKSKGAIASELLRLHEAGTL